MKLGPLDTGFAVLRRICHMDEVCHVCAPVINIAGIASNASHRVQRAICHMGDLWHSLRGCEQCIKPGRSHLR